MIAEVSDDDIMITWDSVDGATGYDIEVDGDVVDIGSDTTSYVHDGLMPNTEHTYRVHAKSDLNISDWTELISKTILSEIPVYIHETVTSTSISLNWDEVSGAFGYDVEADGIEIDNGIATEYVHSRIDATSQVSYYLFNGHGDVEQTISETSEVENTYDYDIFGSPILTIETYANAIRYAGEFYDEESGLYLRARYYDSYIGRFISEDSYWGEDNNPLRLNRYTYVHNDPINFWDPMGHWEQGDERLTVSDQRQIKKLTDAVSTGLFISSING